MPFNYTPDFLDDPNFFFRRIFRKQQPQGKGNLCFSCQCQSVCVVFHNMQQHFEKAGAVMVMRSCPHYVPKDQGKKSFTPA